MRPAPLPLLPVVSLVGLVGLVFAGCAAGAEVYGAPWIVRPCLVVALVAVAVLVWLAVDRAYPAQRRRRRARREVA